MKKVIYILGFLGLASNAWSQCGTDDYNRKLIADQLADGQTAVEYFEEQRDFEYKKTVDMKNKKAIRTIPVVFHILHAYGEENISKEQIEDQIRIINEDFQRKNADASKTRSVFTGRAANFELEFKLARIAPDGSCTEGITRTYDPVNMIEDFNNRDDEAKSSVAAWDRNKYLNIWIVKEIQSSSEGTILGYAQFPGQRASTDGIVMIHDRVGSIGSASFSDKGRTLTHEIGHWLGLYHPFQGGCFGGDGVSDTPPVAEASFGCTAGQDPNTCSSDSPDEPDMVENFMDYANGACMNAFTKGQLARVNGYLSSTNGRSRVVTSSNLIATGVNTTPTCGPIADFWYNSDRILICEGDNVEFEDLSYNGPVEERIWTFEGGTPATSAAANPVIIYTTAGVYKVELEVGNSEGTDAVTRAFFITVRPSTAQYSVPLGEDFEDASSVNSWQLETRDDYGWKRSIARGFSGSSSIQAIIDENTPRDGRFSVTTLPVDLASYPNEANLHFKYAYARRTSANSEILLVLASTDCGESWRTLEVMNAAKLETSEVSPNWLPTSTADWMSKEISLSQYADVKNLLIRFDVIPNQGNSVLLDDINFGKFALSVPTYESDLDLALVPNPAQNKVQIKGLEKYANARVSIVDITGRLLLQQILDPQNTTINTETLVNGVYSVLVLSENKSWSKKLIINK
jgi:PKD repeat protein